MSKAIKIVVVAAVAALAFVAGVKYSEQVKSHASWMFESKEDEVALPDLSNEEIENAASSEQDILTNKAAAESVAEGAVADVAAEGAVAPTAVKK